MTTRVLVLIRKTPQAPTIQPPPSQPNLPLHRLVPHADLFQVPLEVVSPHHLPAPPAPSNDLPERLVLDGLLGMVLAHVAGQVLELSPALEGLAEPAFVGAGVVVLMLSRK